MYSDDPRLKPHQRLGTYFVDLPQTTERLGVPMAAQLRRLQGRDLGPYFRERRKLDAGLELYRREHATRGATDEESKAIAGIVAAMRALLLLATLRVFTLTEEAFTVYKVVDAPVGSHAEDECSIDLIEPDYADTINLILEKQGLIAPSFRTEPEQSANPGSDSETLRPETEPVGQGAA